MRPVALGRLEATVSKHEDYEQLPCGAGHDSRVPSLGARSLAAYKAQNTELGKQQGRTALLVSTGKGGVFC